MNVNIDLFCLPASPWSEIKYSKNTISMMPLCCMAVSKISVLSEAKKSCSNLQVWCLHGFSVFSVFLSAHLPPSVGSRLLSHSSCSRLDPEVLFAFSFFFQGSDAFWVLPVHRFQ